MADPTKKIISAVTMAANIDTNALGKNINLEARTALCLQFEAASDTHVGVLYVQGRIAGATDWHTLQSYTVSSGSGLSELLDMSNLGPDEIRIFYDATSGAGSLNAWWVSKRGAL